MKQLKINSLFLITLTIVSTCFLLLFSYSTSYLYHSYGYDSAIFMVMGKSIASGKQMYTEMFDHKGPILFFIQYIGWSIAERYGIFILQIVNLVCILYTITQICILTKLNTKQTTLVLFAGLTLIGFTNFEGNQSEEYCLLFLLVPLFLSFKYIFIDRGFKHSPIYSIVYGSCFCIIAFNRLSNAAAICGIFVGVLFILIIKKEWINIFYNLLGFLLGVVVVLIPILFHFYYYDSLYDMFYATFLYNFKYANTSQSLLEKLFVIKSNDIFRFFVKVSPNILLIICSAILYRKKSLSVKGLVIAIFISISSYIAVNMGLNSFHYATINLIPLTFGLILIIQILKHDNNSISGSIKVILCIFSISMIAYFIYKDTVAYQLLTKGNYIKGEVLGADYYVDTEKVDSLINQSERDSVFGYNIYAAWYLKTDIIPPFKYFTNQESWIKADSTIYFEINKYLTDTPPIWIIIPNKETVSWTIGIDSNPILKDILENNYRFIDRDINQNYYHRKY